MTSSRGETPAGVDVRSGEKGGRTTADLRVLCVCARDSLRRRITRALIACGAVPCFVSGMEEAAALCKKDPFGVVLLDVGADASLDVDGIERIAVPDRGERPAVLLLSRLKQQDRLLSILEQVNVRNLIATHERSEAEPPILDEHELMVTCHKLLRRDLFGLEKYLSFPGAYIYEMPITSADDREVAVEAVSRFSRALELGRELEQRVANITDELVTNAVYNAPRLADGRPRYAHIDRREKVRLEPHEYARLRYACDARYFALSVTDVFGSLKGETVSGYLRKCFRRGEDQIDDKAGGAGLGIYMAFNSVTQLVFNIAAGRKTEVIALFYVRSESRGFRRSGRSLNLFVEEGG